MNTLFYGDNLQVLRHLRESSVDLIYLDPPYNSHRTYLFKGYVGEDSQAQIKAFADTWHWGPEADSQYLELVAGHASPTVAKAVEAMRTLIGETDLLAYLVMMTARLIELQRVLKPTGSLYLHCDPTASHYLKVVLDAIFGLASFKNEIVWQRFSAKNDPGRYGRSHDSILFYTRGRSFTWNRQFGPFEAGYVEQNYRYTEEGTGRRYRLSDLTAGKPGGDVDFEWHGARPYKGRHWAFNREKLDQMHADGRIVFSRTGMPALKRYLDEQPGVPLQDFWTDIRLTSGSAERLGYPTQKPVALLERIIAASSNPGDLVLDPFCGCGTAIAASQRLGRRWVGIDVTYLAIDVIQRRLREMYGEWINAEYQTVGIPTDMAGAEALFRANPLDFERWAVSLIDGVPNEKQVGARGIDGVVRFFIDHKTTGRALVSVKGGKSLNPSMVRDLRGTVQRERAQLGVLIVMSDTTRGMRDEASHSGLYEWPLTGKQFPQLQIVSVEDLLRGRRPDLPAALPPYVKAPTWHGHNEQLRIEGLQRSCPNLSTRDCSITK